MDKFKSRPVGAGDGCGTVVGCPECGHLKTTVTRLQSELASAKATNDGFAVEISTCHRELAEARAEMERYRKALTEIYNEARDYQSRTGNPVTWADDVQSILVLDHATQSQEGK